MLQNPQRPGKLRFAGTSQYTAHHAILNRDLEILCEPGGKFAALLNSLQMICRKRIFTQRFSKNVGGCDSILDCQINTNATHRRHGMRRVADAQQPRPDTIAANDPPSR